MKYIKIYGPKRSCTNFAKWVLENNFRDVRALMLMLGSKHDPIQDEPSWRVEDHVDRSVDVEPQRRFLAGELPRVREAWRLNQIDYFVVTKHPLACALGVLARWKQERDAFDSDPRAWIARYCREWNRAHASWLSLCDRPYTTVTVVRCDDFYERFWETMERVRRKHRLRPAADHYRFPRVRMRALSDATFHLGPGAGAIDLHGYMSRNFLGRWSPAHRDAFAVGLDHDLLAACGFGGERILP